MSDKMAPRSNSTMSNGSIGTRLCRCIFLVIMHAGGTQLFVKVAQPGISVAQVHEINEEIAKRMFETGVLQFEIPLYNFSCSFRSLSCGGRVGISHDKVAVFAIALGRLSSGFLAFHVGAPFAAMFVHCIYKSYGRERQARRKSVVVGIHCRET